MKKILFVSIVFLMVGCITTNNLSSSYKLTRGMSKDDIISILGPPVKSDFYKDIDEWHYCSTGFSSDTYLALFFLNDTLIAKKSYDVYGMSGSCENFIKRGTYSEPDVVVEIRRGN